MILFPQFAPDRAGYDPTVMTTMENALPLYNSYAPIPSFEATANALPGAPRGVTIVRRNDDSFATYVGTATGLYRFNSSTNGWDDVSGPDAPYSLPQGAFWSFTQFGQQLLATQAGNITQEIDVDTGSAFARLGGSPPIASYNMKVGPFFVLLGISGNEDAMQWSGRNRTDEWRNGQLSAGGQVFGEGGAITGGVGGQNGGVVFQVDAIRRMVFTPTSPYVFNFIKQDLEHHGGGRGCIAPASIVTVNNSAYFLDDNGMYRYTDGQITPIGDERVDRFIRQNAQNRTLLQGTADASSKSIYWAYRSIDVVQPGAGEEFKADKVLGYNWANDKWFLAKIMTGWVSSATTPGTTLEGLDATGYNLDTLPFSLDAAVWKGGRPLIIGFDMDNKLGYFQGPNMRAVLETADSELNPTRRTYAEGLRVYTDANEVFAQVGTKETLEGPVRWRGEQPRSERRGLCWARAEGRWHRSRVILPAGATWSHLTGVHYEDLSDAGE